MSCWQGSLRIALLMALCGMSVHGCRLRPVPQQSATQRQTDQPLEAERISGHQATVRCLRGERAITDGDELRCEDWAYVQANYSAKP